MMNRRFTDQEGAEWDVIQYRIRKRGTERLRLLFDLGGARVGTFSEEPLDELNDSQLGDLLIDAIRGVDRGGSGRDGLATQRANGLEGRAGGQGKLRKHTISCRPLDLGSR